MSKRSSICSFIQQGLKRKRREEEEDEILEPEKRQKKNVVIQLIERVIRPKKRHNKQPCSEFVDLFENFKLPVIEWTNGDLGILQQHEEDDSIFCINTCEYMEFPKPPSTTKRHSKFHSLLIIKEEEEREDWSDDDDDSTLPMTPTLPSNSISKDSTTALLLSQIENLQITT